jgi:hypothetical protein
MEVEFTTKDTKNTKARFARTLIAWRGARRFTGAPCAPLVCFVSLVVQRIAKLAPVRPISFCIGRAVGKAHDVLDQKRQPLRGLPPHLDLVGSHPRLHTRDGVPAGRHGGCWRTSGNDGPHSWPGHPLAFWDRRGLVFRCPQCHATTLAAFGRLENGLPYSVSFPPFWTPRTCSKCGLDFTNRTFWARDNKDLRDLWVAMGRDNPTARR